MCHERLKRQRIDSKEQKKTATTNEQVNGKEHKNNEIIKSDKFNGTLF